MFNKDKIPLHLYSAENNKLKVMMLTYFWVFACANFQKETLMLSFCTICCFSEQNKNGSVEQTIVKITCQRYDNGP